VLAWIVDRLEGLAEADETPIGRLPKPGGIDISGLDVTDETLAELFTVDTASWLTEADLTAEYFTKFGDKVPAELFAQLDALKARLQA
jgi:phosphoenolpyruvate carboxykinase (GTP)